MPQPRLSVLTVVGHVSPEAFERMAASLRRHLGGEVEWVLGVGAGAPDWVTGRLAELGSRDGVRYVALDPAATPAADLAWVASGELVVDLDAGDALAPRAVRAILSAVDAAPADRPVDALYSDYGVLEDDGTVGTVRRLPDWSPERLRHHFYCRRLAVVRRSTLVEAGGPGHHDRAVDHDTLLRVAELAPVVVHLPEAHYLVGCLGDAAVELDRADEPGWDRSVLAVQEHLTRVGVDARARRGAAPGLVRVERAPDLTTSVSIIVPTIGSRAMVWGRRRIAVVEAIESVIAHSRHPDLEFVVVYDLPTPPQVLADLRAIRGARMRLVPFTEPFNFSAKCNVGAAHATGDVLLFLNDDVEAISDDLVETLIAPLREPDVGATGAKLLFENGRLQHAGVIYGDDTIHHRYYREESDQIGTDGELVINREATGVTGACLAVRRTTFDEVGGFTEHLPGNYNDVDFCLKLHHQGYRVLWLHDVVLYHFESLTRERAIQRFETQLMTRRWGNKAVVRERYSSR